jgi:hypothetical protein
VCAADLGFTGGKNDIGAGTDTDFIGACTPALKLQRVGNYQTTQSVASRNAVAKSSSISVFTTTRHHTPSQINAVRFLKPT